MGIEHSYKVEMNWLKDRIGILHAPELTDEIIVATPPQFPDGVEHIWSPEHLFTAAINSCLMTTFLSIAQNSKLDFLKFSSSAAGKLEMTEGKYLMTEVTLSPIVTIASEADREKAMRVLHRAEVGCLISNSVKSKIIFEPTVTIGQREPVSVS